MCVQHGSSLVGVYTTWRGGELKVKQEDGRRSKRCATLALPGHLLAIKRIDPISLFFMCVYVCNSSAYICMTTTTTTRHNYYTPFPLTHTLFFLFQLAAVSGASCQSTAALSLLARNL